MTTVTDSELSPENRRELDIALRKVWRLGANVIVGWRALPFGIEVLHITSYDLPKIAKQHADLLNFDRYIGSEEAFNKLVSAGCETETLSLSFSRSTSSDSHFAINDTIRHYTVTHFECRTIALYDIVSFSVHSPFEQITQVNVLSHYISLAAQRCKSLGMPIDLSMTTTGDGFYVWNRNVGLMADIALYNATLLALAYNAAARQLANTETVPRLRCGVHSGSHYEYYQGSGARSDNNGFIVGDVTINLARLISKAQTNQLLVGSYTRTLADIDEQWRDLLGVPTIDTPTFMALAQNEQNKLVGLPVPGGKIRSVKAYFTGPRVSENEFSIRKYYVKDKHGIEHPCFNAKFNMTTSSNENIFFGLLDKDLKKFDARVDEDEDITIRVV